MAIGILLDSHTLRAYAVNPADKYQVELLKDIWKGPASSNPRSFNEMNGKLYFTAKTWDYGYELWVTDGTTEGTYMVKDIYFDYLDSEPYGMTVFRDKLYFIATSEDEGRELWVSDDTSEGTELFMDFNQNGPSNLFDLNVVGDQLFFLANDGEHGQELWVTNGTVDGTYMVKDINTLVDNYGRPGTSNILQMAELNEKVYFSARDNTHGRELWTSDGTLDGTYMVADINPNGDSLGNPDPNSIWFTPLNGKLIFPANDNQYGEEWWSTDGTEIGTKRFTDVGRYWHSDFIQCVSPTCTTVMNNELYFSGAFEDSQGYYGQELWKTDGTAQGTLMVKDINVGGSDSLPRDLVVLDEKLIFSANDGSSRSLWISNGTAEGTSELCPLSWPSDLLMFDGNVIFHSDDNLWITDGTTEGTTEIHYGFSTICNGCGLGKVLGDKLIFMAATAELGGELYVLSPKPTSPTDNPTTNNPTTQNPTTTSPTDSTTTINPTTENPTATSPTTTSPTTTSPETVPPNKAFSLGGNNANIPCSLEEYECGSTYTGCIMHIYRPATGDCVDICAYFISFRLALGWQCGPC